MKYPVLALMLFLFLASPVFAQDAAKQPSDMQERLALAQKMHEIQPASQQIDIAVSRVAQQMPEADRKPFHDNIMAAIDNKKLEELSIKTMADIFTKEELTLMVGYFSSPQAKSISEKMPMYQDILNPEIMKMLDAAMMKARTGAATPSGTP